MRSYIVSFSVLLSLFCLYTALVWGAKKPADAPSSTASVEGFTVDSLSSDTGRAPASDSSELN